MASKQPPKPTKPIKEEKVQEVAAKIDETDEMKLKMLAALDKPESGDSLYPMELNEHLIEQIRVLTCENDELRKCTFTKDQEINELTKTISELNQRIRDIISGSGPAISSKSAGVISAKITELCKQNRHLVAELEGYKTKVGTLERKILQQQILIKDQKALDNICVCKEEPIDASPDELKELNNKLAQVNKKLYETKNRNLELKNEILVATKILQQELGDKFTSIKELQKELAGWKGRAQQITCLQSRISELEEKLNGKQKDINDVKKLRDQSHIIRDLEMKRKKEVDQALKDLASLRDENTELKKKLDGAKCRIRNLECDSVTIRQKMQTFADKSNHDDLLINEQRNQIKNLEHYYQDILKENTHKMNKMDMDLAEFKKVINSTESKTEAMMRQAAEKTTKIEELRAQLIKYEECSLQSVFFTPMKTATDNEILKLSELINELNKRLDNERKKNEEMDTSNRKLKIQTHKQNRRVKELEDQIQSLKELKTKSLRTAKSTLLRDQSNSQNSVSKQTSSEGQESEDSIESHVSYNNLEKDELKFRLILAEEKYKIMEDKFKMIEEEKAEDYKHLTEMIQTSKQLFNNALSVLQKEKCVCS